ncbi:MAG: acetylxylan esterase, partial [Acidobacteriaceae bacterium]|nr:acetylxylan esterase [Acidobacteriaceae bacterium]
TANLYRPDKPGKFPGILLPLGHWEYGKPAVQTIAANFALKGFVVLTYDPWGQGERKQIYDARYGNSLANQGTEQHLLAGGLSALLGQSFARYRIWDAKRALDYLVSRPEVITDRIGCTGCSGGGTITTYISALDSRIKVAAPACYINTFRLLFSGPLGDSEQSIPNFLASGLDIADYIELFAPKPWLISSTREDFFPLAGARMAFEEAQRWYGLLGADDKIKWAVGPGGHGTPLEIREAIYEWMIRWLKDGNGSAREEPFALLPEHALWAAPKGQVANIAGSREVFDIIRDEYRSSFRHGSRAELTALLNKLIDPPRQAPPIRMEGDRVAFETEPGLELTARLLEPARSDASEGVLLVDTKAEVPQHARDLVNAGNTVLVVTPRGCTSNGSNSGRTYSGDWHPNVQAWLVGRNLPAMRAHDILNAYQILKSRPHVDPAKIRVEASAIAGTWALLAAAVEPGIASVRLQQTPYSFAQAFENPLTRDLHSAIIPGFASHWDLADLVDADRLLWTDPVDWLGHVVPLKGRYAYTPAVQ